MEMLKTDRLKLAAHFVNSTNSPIFLTGKAGTGKTTFLRELTDLTHKTHIIVAPTGIAALHAKGVTIHSQFLLPLGSYLPTREPEGHFGSYGFYTQNTLAKRHTLNLARRKVLSTLDLLVIDEVSMLRADILDAIDYRLRSAKGNFTEPFGGTQVLMIGDLFQLPPIVKDQEWQALGRFYKCMHFFEAQALKQSGMVYVELDKIFRQKDDNFIAVLNRLRENRITREDIAFLNNFYKAPDEIKALKDTITLTTHNYIADGHNRKELDNLKSKSHYFEAIIENEFPESLYPLPKTLELKEGAQIMFIRNDSSGSAAFFNGKMAKVKSIDKGEITVGMADTGGEYVLKREVWENKKYVVNEETKELVEEVIGSFEQYPVKLAWAVTVHKSQGLTFDRAIIDVGKAFAPGQVYVALSRLTSLDGLTLRTRIGSEAINNDPDVVGFTQSAKAQESLEKLLQVHQKKYVERLLVHTFQLQGLVETMQRFVHESQSSMEFEDPQMKIAVQVIVADVQEEIPNTVKYQRQLLNLLQMDEQEKLMDRLEKGGMYYSNMMESCLRKLLVHTAEVERFSRTKSYREGLSEIELLLIRKLGQIRKASFLIPAILKGEVIGKMDSRNESLIKLRETIWKEAREAASENPKFATTKSGRKKTGKGAPKIKLAKGETYEITYALSESGKTIKEISEERGLAESTIKSHLAKGIASGKVSIHQHLGEDLIEEISRLITSKEGDLGMIRQENPDKYDYGTLKMVSVFLSLEEGKQR
ncbi:MAG TPA: helix-turn-helix domain-containing protein [Cyclobacteriaceae bacterium]|nr:helix-turn-helix domain-containing protein [Cyclobacteriaceae bacterium]